MACFGGNDANDHGTRDDSQGLRKRGDAGEDWGEIVSAFEEEGHVVENGPEDNAMDEGEEVGDVGVFVLEYRKREDGVGRDLGFPNDKEGEAEHTENDRNEGVPT